MKKIILSLLAVIIISTASLAQAGFRLGIKGGTNLTKLSGESFNNGYMAGYQLGGFMELDFSKEIGIEPEVLFNEYAGRTSTTLGSVFTNNQDVKLNYLSIPVLLRLNVDKMLTIVVGPQYSILVNPHETTLQNGQDAFKSGDFAAVGGLQINLSALRIYGRYVIGLNNINDVGNQYNWKSQQIQLGIGIKL
ncbi:MAG TPA: porin family protein [Chitinophagaceae bacterium]|nr:porin family protein [Chitinophagaceae bacterium]